MALKHQKTWSYLGSDNGNEILSFNDDIGTRYNIYINKTTNLLDKISTLDYHNLYGDCVNESIYQNQAMTTEGIFLPEKLIRKERGFLESDLWYKKLKTNPKVDTSLGKWLCATCKFEVQPKIEPIKIDKIDQNLWLLSLQDLDNKVMVAEFETYLVAMEAPKNAETCSKVIDVLKKQFPNKAIKYLAVSHHHPDHAGGFAAFANKNISIISTKGNVDFFKKLYAMPHTLNENNASLQQKIDILTVNNNDMMKIEDKTNQLHIYEKGENTDHVKEFLFFYFPLQKTLFIGDLVFFPQNQSFDQGKRAFSVYDVIQRNKLDVQKIYTSWPLKDQKAYGTKADLIQALKKNYPAVE